MSNNSSKKLSFSLTSTAKPPSSRPKLPSNSTTTDSNPQFVTVFDTTETLTPTNSSTTTDSNPQFVTVFDPTETLTPTNSSTPTIAPIANNAYHHIRKPKSLPLPDDVDPTTTFVPDTSTSTTDPASSAIAYGLTIRKNANDTNTNNKSVAAVEPPVDPMLRRYKEDMETLPEDRGFEEFKDIAVEDFAKAVLQGYGWKEGKGIGRNNTKGDTKVVEYDRREDRQGLGFNPGKDAPRKAKDGEWKIGGDSKKKSNGERSRKRERDPEKKEEKKSNGERSRKREREEKRDPEKKEEEEERERERSKEVRWLRSNIKVRVISEKLKKGRLYLKKGEVVDVVGPTTCDILMDEGRELVQGVEQEMLETVLPKSGGSVLVLYGKYKGVYGPLVEKNSKDETGVVRDEHSHKMIDVRLEQIAEYVGDPELLGY